MKVTDIKPYGSDKNKETEVEAMFDHIAPAYDFMNTAMTFGLHKSWRNTALKKLVAKIPHKKNIDILDIATGTGDVAFRLSQMIQQSKIIGIDLSEGMLKIARKKKTEKYPQSNIQFIKGDSLNLPFPNNTFDAITVAYGVRNFSNLPKGLSEMKRVLKPGGTLCIIELSEPAAPPFKLAYRLYSHHIIPFIGKLISGDSRAYKYLPESIAACPQRKEMTTLMSQAGFINATFKSLTLGAVTIYLAQ